ncbi:hypothetical protein RIEGSTA812A_PEG_1043 [invertebrate metagenome]|uniref:Uncharacterized protein n=1 Tax=invertebrate metagenome TaxID=1711999 RepID=A0A484H7J2_9ZZZZ
MRFHTLPNSYLFPSIWDEALHFGVYENGSIAHSMVNQ